MTISITPINVSTDNWGVVFARVNALIDAAANNFVTVNTGPNVGNVQIQGSFVANSVNTLVLSSNTANVNSITVGSATVNSLVANVGSISTANVGTLEVTGLTKLNTANITYIHSVNTSSVTSNTGGFSTINTSILIANTGTINTINTTAVTSNTIVYDSGQFRNANSTGILRANTFFATSGQFEALSVTSGNTTFTISANTFANIQTDIDSRALASRTIYAGTGLQGGGDLTADRTIALNANTIASIARADSAVQANTYATYAAKTTPVDADGVLIVDVAGGNVAKRVTWANIKTTLKAYFDTLYQSASAKLNNLAGLTSSTGGVIIGDGTNWVVESGATLRNSLGLGTGGSPQFTALNVGNASDTTITRVSAGIVAVEGKQVLDVTTENQPVTGGATITSKSLGTQTTGTLTLDVGDCPMQHYTNGGAHTLAPGSVNGASMIDITNNGSAGAITTSGFTKVEGSFTTTNGHKFRCHVSVGNGGSLLIVQALQ